MRFFSWQFDARMGITTDDSLFVDESSCDLDSLVEKAMKLSRKVFSERDENLLFIACQLQNSDSPANVEAKCEVLDVSKKTHALK